MYACLQTISMCLDT